MQEQDPVSKVRDALNLGDDDEEEKKEVREDFSSNGDPMAQSFYRKQGIDFLNF